MNHDKNHLERHPYITGHEKIYEPKEVEIARESEMENIKNTLNFGSTQYDKAMENVQHKYGHE